jgi:hypothetical protein
VKGAQRWQVDLLDVEAREFAECLEVVEKFAVLLERRLAEVARFGVGFVGGVRVGDGYGRSCDSCGAFGLPCSNEVLRACQSRRSRDSLISARLMAPSAQTGTLAATVLSSFAGVWAFLGVLAVGR